jgi:hypothetical protein
MDDHQPAKRSILATLKTIPETKFWKGYENIYSTTSTTTDEVSKRLDSQREVEAHSPEEVKNSPEVKKEAFELALYAILDMIGDEKTEAGRQRFFKSKDSVQSWSELKKMARNYAEKSPADQMAMSKADGLTLIDLLVRFSNKEKKRRAQWLAPYLGSESLDSEETGLLKAYSKELDYRANPEEAAARAAAEQQAEATAKEIVGAIKNDATEVLDDTVLIQQINVLASGEYSHFILEQVDDDTLLHVAIEKGHSLEVITALQKRLGDGLINHMDKENYTALNTAAKYGRVDVMNFLVGKGANLNNPDLSQKVFGGHDPFGNIKSTVEQYHGTDAAFGNIHLAAIHKQWGALKELIKDRNFTVEDNTAYLLLDIAHNAHLQERGNQGDAEAYYDAVHAICAPPGTR